MIFVRPSVAEQMVAIYVFVRVAVLVRRGGGPDHGWMHIYETKREVFYFDSSMNSWSKIMTFYGMFRNSVELTSNPRLKERQLTPSSTLFDAPRRSSMTRFLTPSTLLDDAISDAFELRFDDAR